MEVRPGDSEVIFWKDVGFWKSMFKLSGQLTVLATVVLSGTGAVGEIAEITLKKEEAKAASVDSRVIEAKRETNVAYEDWNELASYYVAKDAACDTALEMYDSPEDITKVIEECHSEGRIE